MTRAFVFAIALAMSSFVLAEDVEDEIAIKFATSELTVTEQTELVKARIIALYPELSKPLILKHVNYHNPEYDIILRANQPLDMQRTVDELMLEPYIEYAKAVGPISIY